MTSTTSTDSKVEHISYEKNYTLASKKGRLLKSPNFTRDCVSTKFFLFGQLRDSEKIVMTINPINNRTEYFACPKSVS